MGGPDAGDAGQNAAARRMTIEEWRAEALRRGGGKFGATRFLCPACGNVASPDDFAAGGADGGRAAEECIGRTMTPRPRGLDGFKPCDWAAYGLFRTLGRGVVVVHPDGTEVHAFPFAD